MPVSSPLTRRFAAAALTAVLVATVTCVEQPTAPRDAAVIHAPVAPALAATTIAHTLLTAGNSTVNQKVCTTASIAPAANALVTVAVLGHHGPTASASPTLTGGGMAAWTRVATVTFDDLTAARKRVSIYRALSPSPGSGPLKITFGSAQANCQWIVSQWRGVETSGSNGANAIVQAGSARANSVSGMVVRLGAFADSRNVAYGVFGVRKTTAGVTPGAGFTEIAERASGETPPSDLQAEWSAGDNTIDAKWSSLRAAGLGLEIKVARAAALDPVASVEVSPDSSALAVRDTVRLTASTLDAGGEPLSGRTVSWTSDRAAVATVSSAGLVTAAGAGSATITATSEGKSGTATVKVSDGIAPVLVGLTFNPSQTVDVSTGAQTITIVGHIKDAGGSGTAQFAVKASAPNGVFLTCAASSPASGDTSDGTWNCPINIPAGADPGTWKLFILVSDVGLSSHTYSEADLTAAGLPTGFTVTSPTPDNAAPAIVSLQLSPASVNVSSGASTMTVTAQLTDDVSGIAQFDFVGTSPSGDKTVTCSDVTAAGQTKLSGTWSCTVTIPADAEAGTWTIYVRATDRTSKFSFLPRADGFPAGFASSFTVTR